MFYIPSCEHSLALWEKKYNFAYVELTLLKGTSCKLAPAWGLVETTKIVPQIRGEANATVHITPYEKLPKGWAWCRLGDIANIISGVSYNKKDISDNGIRILRGGNIQNSKVLILEDDIFISENYKNETNSVKIGDIVIVASTGSNLLIGKAGFIKKDLDNTQIGAFLRIIRPISDICSFLQLIFISDFYKTYIRDLAKGTNINNIKNEYLTEFIIPLPPLAEQHRIVEKIETFFASFDQIEKMLT